LRLFRQKKNGASRARVFTPWALKKEGKKFFAASPKKEVERLANKEKRGNVEEHHGNRKRSSEYLPTCPWQEEKGEKKFFLLEERRKGGEDPKGGRRMPVFRKKGESTSSPCSKLLVRGEH